MYTSIHVSPNGSLMWIYTLFSAWNWKLKLSMLSVCLFVIVCWAMNNKWKKSLLRNHWICNWSYPDDINRFLPGYRPVPIGVVKIKWPIELVVHWPFRRYAHCGEEFFETDLSVPIRIVGLEKNSLLCSSVCVCGFFFVCVWFFFCVCVCFFLFILLFILFIYFLQTQKWDFVRRPTRRAKTHHLQQKHGHPFQEVKTHQADTELAVRVAYLHHHSIRKSWGNANIGLMYFERKLFPIELCAVTRYLSVKINFTLKTDSPKYVASPEGNISLYMLTNSSWLMKPLGYSSWNRWCHSRISEPEKSVSSFSFSTSLCFIPHSEWELPIFVCLQSEMETQVSFW